MQQGKPIWISPPCFLIVRLTVTTFLRRFPFRRVYLCGRPGYRWVVHLLILKENAARSSRMSFSVENDPPVVRIISHGDDILQSFVGDILLLEADVYDAEDEQLGFRTEVDWWVSEPETDSPTRVASGLTLSYPVNVPGAYVFEARAADRFGRVGSARVEVVVEAGLRPAFVQSVPVIRDISFESLPICPLENDDLPRARLEAVITANATAEDGPELFFRKITISFMSATS